MKITRLGSCLLFLLLLTFTAAEARADTLVITGGSVIITSLGGDGVATFNLLGSNFSFDGGPAPFVAIPGCWPCAPGRVLSSNFGTSAVNSVTFQINGVGFDTRNFSIGNALSLFGPSYVVAETVTLPFTFTGFVTVTGSMGEELADHIFTGQGFVTLEHQLFSPPGGPSFFQFSRATYNFTPAPVPEPGTLLLLATGLAGAGGAALRRRRALKDADR